MKSVLVNGKRGYTYSVTQPNNIYVNKPGYYRTSPVKGQQEPAVVLKVWGAPCAAAQSLRNVVTAGPCGQMEKDDVRQNHRRHFLPGDVGMWT